MVGEFVVKRNGCFVKPHDDRISQWVEIAEGMEIPESTAPVNRVGVAAAKIEVFEDLDGMIVNVEILDFGENGDNPVGKVIEVLGSPDDFRDRCRNHHPEVSYPSPVSRRRVATGGGLRENDPEQ